MTFADMPIGQRNRWLAWCGNHDWGQQTPAYFDAATGEVVTSSQECGADFVWSEVEARHKTPAALKAWAGY